MVSEEKDLQPDQVTEMKKKNPEVKPDGEGFWRRKDGVYVRKDKVVKEESGTVIEGAGEKENTETAETKGKRKSMKGGMLNKNKNKGLSKKKEGAKSRGREEFSRTDARETVTQKIKEKEDLENPFEEMDWDMKKSSALYFYFKKMKV